MRWLECYHGPGSAKVRPQPLTYLATTMVDHLYPAAENAGDQKDSLLGSEDILAVKQEMEVEVEADQPNPLEERVGIRRSYD